MPQVLHTSMVSQSSSSSSISYSILLGRSSIAGSLPSSLPVNNLPILPGDEDITTDLFPTYLRSKAVSASNAYFPGSLAANIQLINPFQLGEYVLRSSVSFLTAPCIII